MVNLTKNNYENIEIYLRIDNYMRYLPAYLHGCNYCSFSIMPAP